MEKPEGEARTRENKRTQLITGVNHSLSCAGTSEYRIGQGIYRTSERHIPALRHPPTWARTPSELKRRRANIESNRSFIHSATGTQSVVILFHHWQDPLGLLIVQIPVGSHG